MLSTNAFRSKRHTQTDLFKGDQQPNNGLREMLFSEACLPSRREKRRVLGSGGGGRGVVDHMAVELCACAGIQQQQREMCECV